MGAYSIIILMQAEEMLQKGPVYGDVDLCGIVFT